MRGIADAHGNIRKRLSDQSFGHLLRSGNEMSASHTAHLAAAVNHINLRLPKHAFHGFENVRRNEIAARRNVPQSIKFFQIEPVVLDIAEEPFEQAGRSMRL